jgi:hypothetical protein
MTTRTTEAEGYLDCVPVPAATSVRMTIGLGVEGEDVGKTVVAVCVGPAVGGAGYVAPFCTNSTCCSYTTVLSPRLFNLWICSMVVPYVMAMLHND